MRHTLLLFSIFFLAHASCPDGLELVRDGQCRGFLGSMKIQGADATNTAIAKCAELKALPVIIHNQEQQSYWKDKTSSFNNLLLGMVCNTTSKRWGWADGSALDFIPSEGTYSLDDRCDTKCDWFIFSGNPGVWLYECDSGKEDYDVHCISEVHQVQIDDKCEMFDNDSEDGNCYQIGATAANWTDAQMICKKLGANLASIHNENENSFIRRLAVSRGAVSGVFLGASSSGKDNFNWIDGSTWDYANFYPGFPMAGSGDCIAMDTSVSSGDWKNTDCAAKLPVACVREQKVAVGRNVTCNSKTWQEGTVITSPGFPYDASLPCDYYLTVAEGKKVLVEIILLEANSCCDRLVIYDGYFGGYELANITGYIPYARYQTSESNVMRVSWLPNGAVNVRGMAIAFRGV